MSRLEAMRGVSKGPKPKVASPAKGEFQTVWIVAENETGRTVGVFQDENEAWAESEAIWDVYRIECEVEPMLLDGKLSLGEVV